MRKADKLSRKPDLKVEIENNNENQKLIKEKQIREIIEVVVKGLEIMLVEKIKRAREKDKEVVKVIKEMKKTEVKVLRGNEWEIKEELVLKEEKMYMLKDEELRLEVIQLYYNMLAARYLEDDRIDYKELLVTRSNERYKEIYRVI